MPFLPMALAALQLLQGGKNLIAPQRPVPPGVPLGGAAGGYQPPQPMEPQQGGSMGGDARLLAAQVLQAELERRKQRARDRQAQLEEIAQIGGPSYNQMGPMP